MREVMIGNFAIARGLTEAGLELAAAYPGTPSSEILPGIVEFKKERSSASTPNGLPMNDVPLRWPSAEHRQGERRPV